MKYSINTLVIREIIGGLAHNINTPLNLILGYAQQLQQTHADLPYLQKIVDSGFKIDDLVQSSLKNIYDRLSYEVLPFDLNSLIKNQLIMYSNDLRIKRNITFDINYNHDECIVSNIPILICTLLDCMIYSVLEYAPLKIRIIIGKSNGTCSIVVSIFKDGSYTDFDLRKLIPEAREIYSVLCIETNTKLYNIDSNKLIIFNETD